MVAHSYFIGIGSAGPYFNFCRILSFGPVYLPYVLTMKSKFLKKPYTDLYIIAAGFGVLTLIFNFPYLLIVSALALLSALHPKTAAAVAGAWEKFGKALGWVNSRILLSVFFVVVISPFALFYRLIRRKNKGMLGLWEDYKNPGTDFTKPW